MFVLDVPVIYFQRFFLKLTKFSTEIQLSKGESIVALRIVNIVNEFNELLHFRMFTSLPQTGCMMSIFGVQGSDRCTLRPHQDLVMPVGVPQIVNVVFLKNFR
ncbi:hypothetical protein FHG87_012719 [Trinorchestia longiramus]|nr:hypothetical protein FHG87_012719 [Trinorchestia longiramus]